MSARLEKSPPPAVTSEEDEPRRSKRLLSDKRMRGKAPLPESVRRATPAPPSGNYAPLGGGFLLAVAFPFLAITMLVPQWTGSLGQSIEAGLFALSGSTSLLVPLMILSYAMHFLLPRHRRPVQMTWAPTLLWFNLVLLAQRMGAQGGRLGALVDNGLVAVVGPVGSWLISLACFPLCLLAVCRVHPQEAGHALATLLHAIQDRLGELFVWLHTPSPPREPQSCEHSCEESGEGSRDEELRLFSMETPLIPKSSSKTCAPPRGGGGGGGGYEDSWEGEERLPFDLTPPAATQREEFPAIPRRQPPAEKITFFPTKPPSAEARPPVTLLEPLSALEPVLPPQDDLAGPVSSSTELDLERTLIDEGPPPPRGGGGSPAGVLTLGPPAGGNGCNEAPSEESVPSQESVVEEPLSEEPLSEEPLGEEPLGDGPSVETDDSLPEEPAVPPVVCGRSERPSTPLGHKPSAGPGPEYLEPNGQLRLFPGEVKAPPPPYRLPPLALLNDAPINRDAGPPEDKSLFLLDALASFGVQATLLAIVRGPAVTRYELQPARGVKVSRFTSLTNDIALALAATAVRIEAPIPGKSAIGIEIPNAMTDLVVLKDILASSRFRKSSGMSIALGKDLGGNPTFTNLQKMPHLLVAGTTGSGKSVCVNGLILSLMYRFSPRQLQLLMIDPKQVELSIYEGIPHLISLSRTPESKNEGSIICDPKRAAMALHQIVELMEYRYGLFASARVRNLEEYNQTAEEPLPWVVVIIDELADLMMVAAKTVETSICRIAQKARAAGIHLVLATQRPSADVITGLIKVNVPSRIAFAVSSQVDSRVILDTGGAEQLLGKGDMLFCPVDASDPRRVQGCYVTNEEILRVVEWWKAQASPENLISLQAQDVAEDGGDDPEEDADDALVEQALSVVLRRQQASASLLQTELKVGYARARRLIYLMEKKGYIGPAEGSKPRKILYAGGK